MKALLDRVMTALRGDAQADRVVPPTGHTATLTLFSAAVMTFLAVFALALSLATGRLADRWASELARTSTLRISAPAEQMEAQTRAALRVLETTQGVASARALSVEEQRALLAPWFGPDVPVETLPIPQLVEIVEDGTGYDAAGLRLRLQAEVPGAVLDAHTRWRRPLVTAASRLRLLGLVSILLIGTALLWSRRWRNFGRRLVVLVVAFLLILSVAPFDALLIAPLEDRIPRVGNLPADAVGRSRLAALSISIRPRRAGVFR